MTKAHVCEQLAQSHYLAVEQMGIKRVTFRTQVRHRNHYTTKPHLGVAMLKVQTLAKSYHVQVKMCLWIRNCSAYYKPMMSYALGELAGLQQMLPHMQLQAAHRLHGRHLEVWRHIIIPPASSVDTYFLVEQSCQIYPDSLWWSRRLFLRVLPQSEQQQVE